MCKGGSQAMDMEVLRELTIQSLIEELYNKWEGDPTYYVDDTLEGKKAKIDAYIIEWLRTYLDD